MEDQILIFLFQKQTFNILILQMQIIFAQHMGMIFA
jgi:hypothetical protein